MIKKLKVLPLRLRTTQGCLFSPLLFNVTLEGPCVCVCVCVCARRRTHTWTLNLLSHVWLCSPMESSPPGSSVHGIFQPRMLEWVAISCSRGSSRPRDLTHVSCISCIGSWTLYYYAIWGAPLEVLPTPIKGKKERAYRLERNWLSLFAYDW